jgi:hypothetical protein
VSVGTEGTAGQGAVVVAAILAAAGLAMAIFLIFVRGPV